MQPIDFFAIGDIVLDDFIRLKDASVHCKLNNEDCEICMRWGDKIPYEALYPVPAVGNASNAAVAAARLGLPSALRAYVGADAIGAQCLEVLKKEGVDTSLMVTQEGKSTNHHFVLSYEAERTILVKHEAFDYSVPEMPEAPKWIYLSSLGENSEPYHEQWMAYLDAHPETKLAFQPGTYQIAFSKDKKDYWTGHPDDYAALYKRTDIFFCNKEEAERILGIESTDDKKKLLAGIQALGPKIVVITDDRKGAYAADHGGKFYFIPLYPDARPPLERTGAGDAFASSITAALALGKPLEEALLWGPINAMSVVQEVGAQRGLLSREKLEAYLKAAPAEYALGAL